MKTVSLKTSPNQTVRTVLDGQNCTLHVFQRGDYLYADLSVDEETVFQGRMCLHGVPLNLYANNLFKGMLFFADMAQKDGTPNYEELGTRYRLFFASADELEAL